MLPPKFQRLFCISCDLGVGRPSLHGSFVHFQCLDLSIFPPSDLPATYFLVNREKGVKKMDQNLYT
jgi:hypothetical protein